MSARIRFALCLALGLLVRSATLAEGGDAAFDAQLVDDLSDGILSSHSLSEAVTIASGSVGADRAAADAARIDKIVDAAVARAGKTGGAQRRARRILAELHRTTLLRYEPTADRFNDLLDRGTYNCVSSTLLFVIAARRAGLEPQVVETPRHVFATVEAGGRRIEVETTSPLGVDVERDLGQFQRFVLGYKYVTEDEIARRGIQAIYDEFHKVSRPITPERAVAFLYHNAAVRALQAGDAVSAARRLISAARIYPDLAYRSEDLRMSLALAIRELYDAGRFLEAFRLGEVAMESFPGRMTVADRFVAVAVRAVEEAARKGSLALAEDLETRALRLLGQQDDARRRLESRTAADLARAAVFSGDWGAARRHAERFGAVADDPIEAHYLTDWVERRASDLALAEADSASEADPGGCGLVRKAIESLGSHGLYEEALAVGQLHRQNSAQDTCSCVLGPILRAAAAGRVDVLLRSESLQEAEAVLETALRQWPSDPELLGLRQRALQAGTQPPHTGGTLGGDGPSD
ncbi:MAG TPA: hypothetical protein VFG76_09430 [Candidatus Polarisedimenticolia bacterium]|nr:hypothetical protein [Candidatus Polarisedimenticolia bacterium]